MNNVFERKATVYSIDDTMRVETCVKLINEFAADLRMPKGDAGWKFWPTALAYIIFLSYLASVCWLAIRTAEWIAR